MPGRFTNAVTIPGFAINPFGLNVPLSGGTMNRPGESGDSLI